MKVLVVFYSLEGNTRFLAQKIAEATGADVLELKLKKETVKPGSLSKFFWGGKQVLMKEEPELLPFGFDPEAYELLFIGTPVWAWSYSPPVASFFSSAKLSGKKIALFSSSSGSAGKTFENMKEKLQGNKFAGEIEFKDPLKNDPKTRAEEAKKWAIGIMSE